MPNRPRSSPSLPAVDSTVNVKSSGSDQTVTQGLVLALVLLIVLVFASVALVLIVSQLRDAVRAEANRPLYIVSPAATPPASVNLTFNPPVQQQ